jgi:hypothetical protein
MILTETSSCFSRHRRPAPCSTCRSPTPPKSCAGRHRAPLAEPHIAGLRCRRQSARSAEPTARPSASPPPMNATHGAAPVTGRPGKGLSRCSADPGVHDGEPAGCTVVVLSRTEGAAPPSLPGVTGPTRPSPVSKGRVAEASQPHPAEHFAPQGRSDRAGRRMREADTGEGRRLPVDRVPVHGRAAARRARREHPDRPVDLLPPQRRPDRPAS